VLRANSRGEPTSRGGANPRGGLTKSRANPRGGLIQEVLTKRWAVVLRANSRGNNPRGELTARRTIQEVQSKSQANPRY
jgi:hypothetical protein